MKKIITILLMTAMMFTLSGCIADRQANTVSYNLSLEADNFNVVRQLTVINCLQGDVIFQMTGRMSITADSSDNQLEILVEAEKGLYQKHFIGLSDNVTYTVEQLNVKNVDNYNYVLNFNPKMWLPIAIENVD